MKGYRIQQIGKGKHDMKITDIQQIVFSGFNPTFFIERLAFRTLAITTGVVLDTREIAAIARIYMTAQNGRSTVFNCSHDL